LSFIEKRQPENKRKKWNAVYKDPTDGRREGIELKVSTREVTLTVGNM